MMEKEITTLQKLKQIIKRVNSISKSFFYICLCEAIIGSIIPFVGIWYGKKIVDCFVEGATFHDTFGYAIKMAVITLVLGVIKVCLEKVHIVKSRYVEDKVHELVGLKSVRIKYSTMEKKETLAQLEKAMRGTSINGGIGQLYQSICMVFQHVLRLVYVLIICVGYVVYLFQNKTQDSNSIWYVMVTSLLVIAVVILSVFFNKKIASKYAAVSKKISDDTMEANRHYGYFFSFMTRYSQGKDIRIYNMVDLIDRQMDKCTSDIYNPETENVRASVRNSVSAKVVNSVVEVLLYIYVGIQVVVGLITLGDLTLYVGALKLSVSSINEMVNTWVWVRIRSDFIFYWIDYLNIEDASASGCRHLDIDKNESYTIEFKDVSFQYPNTDTMVLNHVSMKINCGDKIAIVGVNGAGKTTLIKLLCRLYAPTEGEILLNGVNINEYLYDDYLKIFSVVFQDYKLFSFSIEENVAASDIVDRAKVVQCLEDVGVMKSIEKFSKGIETYLYNNTEKGVEISGGEGQKISIARALYKDAPFVILDEPTSALDPISENNVYESFFKLVREKTAIFVSHRMSSCKFCEKIYVFEDGRIIQNGSHDELISNEQGRYVELWNSQAQYYKD